MFERVGCGLGAEIGRVSKVFSQRTLRKFEDASASIPLRPLVRAFEAVAIRMADDPDGGAGGARRTQFRRYVSGVDQRDPQQLERLGHALGALIAEVASSKEDFLVKAAESDGFVFADGVFRPAETAPSSFAIARAEDFALIEDRGRRLYLLANDSPQGAIGGARELLQSVCLTVLRLTGARPVSKKTDLAEIAKSALEALKLAPAGIEQLGAVVAGLGKLRKVSPRHARLAIGAGVAFSGFVAETYAERAEWAVASNQRGSVHQPAR